MLLLPYATGSAVASKLAAELSVLLGVTYIRLDDHSECGGSEMEELKADYGKIR